MSLKVALAEAKTIAELWPIVDNAGYGLSILGRRYIFVPGYEGEVPIDALAARVIEVINERKFQFSLYERYYGRGIAIKISTIYERSDAQVQQQGFLIKFFVSLRNLPNVLSLSSILQGKTCSSTRWYWMDCDNNSIRGYQFVFSHYYTRNQYYPIWHFGRTPEESHRFVHREPEKRNELVDCWR